jgi:uncharacterized protein YeaO (DUF488 family)
MIQIKRAYNPIALADGQRFLVDWLCLRAVKREALILKDWPMEGKE